MLLYGRSLILDLRASSAWTVSCNFPLVKYLSKSPAPVCAEDANPRCRFPQIVSSQIPPSLELFHNPFAVNNLLKPGGTELFCSEGMLGAVEALLLACFITIFTQLKASHAVWVSDLVWVSPTWTRREERAVAGFYPSALNEGLFNSSVPGGDSSRINRHLMQLQQYWHWSN